MLARVRNHSSASGLPSVRMSTSSCFSSPSFPLPFKVSALNRSTESSYIILLLRSIALIPLEAFAEFPPATPSLSTSTTEPPLSKIVTAAASPASPAPTMITSGINPLFSKFRRRVECRMKESNCLFKAKCLPSSITSLSLSSKASTSASSSSSDKVFFCTPFETAASPASTTSATGEDKTISGISFGGKLSMLMSLFAISTDKLLNLVYISIASLSFPIVLKRATTSSLAILSRRSSGGSNKIFSAVPIPNSCSLPCKRHFWHLTQ
mmetsp:Transcript_26381/g.42733  ORF Transcript_26381/g.42733 Transcript_26381/m.42733 type:complete len:267 (+) Transcript_26381:5880-6680(+)